MTQEQKELLLKDLCARLPYKTKIQLTKYSDLTGEKLPSKIKILDYCMLGRVQAYCKDFRKDEIKPYLFPLSSMTDEQRKELRNLIYEHFTLDDEFNEGICFKIYGDILVWLDEKPINECYFIFDYFSKNHFDYRGLIGKGLAIDATGLNIY